VKPVSYTREEGEAIGGILNDVHRLAMETSILSCKVGEWIWKRNPKSLKQLAEICDNARTLAKCADVIEEILKGTP
jgi:hypothetical protein